MTLEGAMLFVIDRAMGGIIRLAQYCAITDDCTVNVQPWSKRTDLSLFTSELCVKFRKEGCHVVAAYSDWM